MATNHKVQIVNATEANPADPIQDPAAVPFDPAQLLAQLPTEALITIPATVPATSDAEDDQTVEFDTEDIEETIPGLDQDVLQDFLDFFETTDIASS